MNTWIRSGGDHRERQERQECEGGIMGEIWKVTVYVFEKANVELAKAVS